MPNLKVRTRLTRREMLAGISAASVLRHVKSAAIASAARWDHIVVGAGVFGAWIAWHLQHSGGRVLLVDPWGPGHSRASSGGETRLIRTEYDGDPLYTGMAWRSLAAWRALASRHEPTLFHEVGALYLYAESAPVDKSIALNRELGIPIEPLTANQMARRWPQIALDDIAFGVLQPTMGALMARRAVQTVVREFQAAGGLYRQIAIEPPQSNGTALAEIRASNAERLRARNFIFACGPWLPRVFPDVVGARIAATRQEVFFFAPSPGDVRFEPANLPAWVDTTSKDLHYGFPDIEARGFKIALDALGPPIDPDTADRRISDVGLSNVRTYLARRFPALADRPLAESRVCQYENSPTREFLIDRHPAWADTWIVGGGSGHGFKHGPAVGRYVADLVAGLRSAESRFTIVSHDAQHP